MYPSTIPCSPAERLIPWATMVEVSVILGGGEDRIFSMNHLLVWSVTCYVSNFTLGAWYCYELLSQQDVQRWFLVMTTKSNFQFRGRSKKEKNVSHDFLRDVLLFRFPPIIIEGMSVAEVWGWESFTLRDYILLIIVSSVVFHIDVRRE